MLVLLLASRCIFFVWDGGTLHSDTLRIAGWFGHGSDTCFLPEAVATPSMIMDLHLKFERG